MLSVFALVFLVLAWISFPG